MRSWRGLPWITRQTSTVVWLDGDSLGGQPLLSALQRLPFLELKEVSFLFRIREQDLAIAGRPVRGLEARLQAPAALRVLAMRKEVEQVPQRALSHVAGESDVARIARHLGVPLAIALEHLLDVPRLAIEKMRNLVGTALEAHDQAFPIDVHLE